MPSPIDSSSLKFIYEIHSLFLRYVFISYARLANSNLTFECLNIIFNIIIIIIIIFKFEDAELLRIFLR